MICENNRAITFSEALDFDAGLLQYLYFEVMKKSKSKKAAAEKQNEIMSEALSGTI